KCAAHPATNPSAPTAPPTSPSKSSPPTAPNAPPAPTRKPEMPARAMWKAELAIGKSRGPVKLYAGVQDKNVHFHLLHEKDEARVEQRLVDPETNEPVPNE